MKVAITGSTGLLGQALGKSLEERGDEVVRVARGSAGGAGADWSPAEGWVREGVFDGCDAVVHLSGASVGEGRWTAARKAELRSSRIDSTRLLVAHLASLDPKPRRLVVASAVGFYGDRGDESLTEESPRGQGFLADMTVDWEAESEKANAAGIPTAMARYGVVFANDAPAFKRLTLPFRLGAGGRLGSGRQYMPWITLHDAVAATTHLLDGDATGPVNVVAPVATTNAGLTRALGRVMRRPAFMMVPRFAMRLALGELADALLFASNRVVPERLVADGFEFSQPEVEGALRSLLRGD
ncbi:MAG: TIGR01777 family oxidoreductase [Chloroflexota bacterium]|nr:TIGR01777 family oxidoreductase [Chloroflexota bacterium]